MNIHDTLISVSHVCRDLPLLRFYRLMRPEPRPHSDPTNPEGRSIKRTIFTLLILALGVFLMVLGVRGC